MHTIGVEDHSMGGVEQADQQEADSSDRKQDWHESQLSGAPEASPGHEKKARRSQESEEAVQERFVKHHRLGIGNSHAGLGRNDDAVVRERVSFGDWEVTSHRVSWSDLDRLRHLDRTLLLSDRAPSPEAATRRWRSRAGNIAFEHDASPVALNVWVWDRDG